MGAVLFVSAGAWHETQITIATVSVFLGSKIEETRCMLGDGFFMSYGIMYKWDPSAPQRIRQRRDVYYKQKELKATCCSF